MCDVSILTFNIFTASAKIMHVLMIFPPVMFDNINNLPKVFALLAIYFKMVGKILTIISPLLFTVEYRSPPRHAKEPVLLLFHLATVNPPTLDCVLHMFAKSFSALLDTLSPQLVDLLFQQINIFIKE